MVGPGTGILRIGKRANTKRSRHRLGGKVVSAGALPSASTGAQALGAVAVGAFALGALAIGALAIGRLAVGRARIKRLEIEELVVRRFQVTEKFTTPPESAADT